MMAARVFFSYSHRDEALRDELETHLALLKRQEAISAWHDRRIEPGQSIDRAIDEQMSAADIILLLVSPDFLASDYCYERELRTAIERHDAGLATVIPVILRPCDWLEAPFGNIVACPTDGKPVTSWSNRDEAFLTITRTIREAARVFDREEPLILAPPAPPAARSSNLRVTRVYTQDEKNLHTQDAYEYVREFFRNSLVELGQRHAGYGLELGASDDGDNIFWAQVKRHGESIAECTLTLWEQLDKPSILAFAKTIGAVENWAEMLVSESSRGELMMRPIGFLGMVGFSRDKMVSVGEAAELFWAEFLRPLQY